MRRADERLVARSEGKRVGKRWIVMAALLITAAYPASSGPAYYMAGRYARSDTPYLRVYQPLEITLRAAPSPVMRLYRRYISWWYGLGWDHSGRPLDTV
jgi:hypothetical protein